ncbi:site-specific integrase [Pseudomonas sp. PDM26]|uniref:site-specific integrase n=1 Tax=Pseudomonas TaxID=286 RepID=UPI001C4750AD|nr:MULTISPECIES: site-specific integrase [Pseudomonas]MBV7547555.1 site-specific integrase [Pseudomonas sp. PDM26]MCT9827492.1 site-specific integrase [Pseudomonas veronii]
MANLIPLFESHDRFLELNHNNLSQEQPVVISYLESFPGDLCAIDGYRAVRSFLRSYEGISATFNSYRTHVERLLLWTLLVCKKPLLEMTRQDGERFMEFCIKPPIDWIGPVVKARYLRVGGRTPKPTDTYTINTQWRPFFLTVKKPDLKLAQEQNKEPEVKPYNMKQDSIAQIFAVCGSFFQWAADEGLSNNANPIRAIKQKSQYKQRVVAHEKAKSLTALQWSFVLETAKLMADDAPVELQAVRAEVKANIEELDEAGKKALKAKLTRLENKLNVCERTLFIIATIYSMYLRVSDMVGRDNWKPMMSDFRKDDHGNWWFHVIGKGNKSAKISVKDEYMNVWMARYRRFLNLTPAPYPGDSAPLLQSLKGRAGLSEGHIRSLVQEVFDYSLERMRAEGFPDDDIKNLRSASLHWLRHTSATADAKVRDHKDLQADLRHQSLATTVDTYYNSRDEERHRSNKNLSIEDR